jgi:hypothetical protein
VGRAAAAAGGRRGNLILAVLMAAALPWATAAAAEAVADADAGATVVNGADSIAVQVRSGDSGIEVDARCVVEAPVAAAWAVLTDYDGIDDFVGSMRESRVAGRGPNHVLVEQVGVSRLFLFRRQFRATLFVEEAPDTLIRFEDVLGKDFETYRGEWRLVEEPGGVAIVYHVTAKPHVAVPDFLARGLFRRTTRDLLAQVRTEIERRAARAGSGGSEPRQQAAGATD